MNAESLVVSAGIPASSMPAGRALRAYLVETKYAFRAMLRAPVFLVLMIAMPILMYLLIGIGVAGSQAADDPKVALFLFSGFLVFAVSSPGLFGFGISLAVERQSGVLNLKRVQPMPAAACLLSKMITAMASTGLIILLLIPLALWLGHVHLSAGQIANLVWVSMIGVLPFCSIGFLIGTIVTGTAAPGVVNVFLLPMLYLSGIFFPLPSLLQPQVFLWPTFYLNQIIWNAAGIESVLDIKISVAVLLGITVLCTGLATRRLSRMG
jgi:ABC-2 type transport system permease protein